MSLMHDRITTQMTYIISLLEDLRAEMILANYVPHADSLLTSINDLLWQHHEITKYDVGNDKE